MDSGKDCWIALGGMIWKETLCGQGTCLVHTAVVQATPGRPWLSRSSEPWWLSWIGGGDTRTAQKQHCVLTWGAGAGKRFLQSWSWCPWVSAEAFSLGSWLLLQNKQELLESKNYLEGKQRVTVENSGWFNIILKSLFTGEWHSCILGLLVLCTTLQFLEMFSLNTWITELLSMYGPICSIVYYQNTENMSWLLFEKFCQCHHHEGHWRFSPTVRIAQEGSLLWTEVSQWKSCCCSFDLWWVTRRGLSFTSSLPPTYQPDFSTISACLPYQRARKEMVRVCTQVWMCVSICMRVYGHMK